MVTSPTDPGTTGDRTQPGRLFAEVAPSDGEADLAQLAQEIPAQFTAWAGGVGFFTDTPAHVAELRCAFTAGWAAAEAYRAAGRVLPVPQMRIYQCPDGHGRDQRLVPPGAAVCPCGAAMTEVPGADPE